MVLFLNKKARQGDAYFEGLLTVGISEFLAVGLNLLIGETLVSLGH
jgi:hypothetical protein